MHPLVSLAARDTFGSAWAVVCGDAEGSAWARKIATATGMRVATPKALDRVRYHAAAALMANGAAALAAAACELLQGAGLDDGHRLLGPLLRSVADNVEHSGLPAALTGPVRRGDVDTVRAHLEAIATVHPNLTYLYVASARAQLTMAQQLNEAAPENFHEIARALDKHDPNG